MAIFNNFFNLNNYSYNHFGLNSGFNNSYNLGNFGNFGNFGAFSSLGNISSVTNYFSNFQGASSVLQSFGGGFYSPTFFWGGKAISDLNSFFHNFQPTVPPNDYTPPNTPAPVTPEPVSPPPVAPEDAPMGGAGSAGGLPPAGGSLEGGGGGAGPGEATTPAIDHLSGAVAIAPTPAPDQGGYGSGGSGNDVFVDLTVTTPTNPGDTDQPPIITAEDAPTGGAGSIGGLPAGGSLEGGGGGAGPGDATTPAIDHLSGAVAIAPTPATEQSGSDSGGSNDDEPVDLTVIAPTNPGDTSQTPILTTQDAPTGGAGSAGGLPAGGSLEGGGAGPGDATPPAIDYLSGAVATAPTPATEQSGSDSGGVDAGTQLGLSGAVGSVTAASPLSLESLVIVDIWTQL